jgi:hypothetical protein
MTNSRVDSPTQMKDGSIAKDPRLGRLPSFDERSRDYPLRALLTSAQERTLRSYSWWCPLMLDQLMTSACTGCSATYDLAASPKPLKQPNGLPFDFPWANNLYRMAQTMDEWSGEDYEGSSLLGAARALQKLGFIGDYYWAFGIDDVLAALSHLGPVVVGTNWHSEMFRPDSKGLIAPNGPVEGGHAYLLRRVIVSESSKARAIGSKNNRRGMPLIGGINSWGASWGVNGHFFIWADQMEALLKAQGDARITVLPYVSR